MEINRHCTVRYRCACDIPSHSYTWSFEPKTDWSSVYAGSNEIFKYFNDFADKYGLRQYVRTNHQVVSANWNHRRDGYDIAVRSLDSNQVIHDRCDILINATGILNSWRWPDIPGLDKYKGALLHTANWDDNVQLEGKRVGLIGNGYVLYPFGLKFYPNIYLTGCLGRLESKFCPPSNP